MSQDNLEVVEAMGDAWNAGDMDALRELFDPDVIVRVPEGWPEPGPFVGREEVMRQWERNREAWNADTFEAISIDDAGDRVVVRLVWTGVSRGPDSQLEFTAVYTIRNGRVSYQESFWNHVDALEALGLSERATSRDNVEIARRAWKAYADHGIDGSLDYFAEDCVVEDFPDMPDRASYVGREGVRERDRHFAETWGDFVIEPQEFIDAGADVVVVTVAIRGHGKGSGTPIDAPSAFVYELRDGKIVRDRAFTSKSQALEAAGLS